MPTRNEMWDRLHGTFDIVIVGGGINGAGIARDAAHRGMKVAVLEMGDIASGTSSRSSKLVHGGLRYLEQREFSLVFESVSERRILLDIAPHLVNPMGFIFPVYKGGRHNIWAINAGMWLYEGLSLFRSPKRHQRLGKADLERLEPALTTENIKGAPLYYDCATDDARLTLETGLDAVRAGAVMCNWAKVVGFVKDDLEKLVAVVVEDQLSGTRKEVRGNAIINATGPWTDDVVRLSAPPVESTLLRPTKGVHIVVTRACLPVNHAVVCFHPSDGRTLFAIPWGDRTYIGTTDTDYEGDPADVAADLADVDYLINASNHYFPRHQLTHDHIISTWAGLRPLIAPPGEKDESINESAVSREHQIIFGHDGLITIAGGKLTTYRRMAQEVVDNALKFLRLTAKLPEAVLDAHTDEHPLPGAVGWPEDDDAERVARQVADIAEPTLSDETCLLLANTYGTRALDIARLVRDDRSLGKPLIAGRPEIVAQIDWGVRVELAATVSDILMRRTQIYFRDLDQGLGAVEAVAQRLQSLIGWTEVFRDASVAAYRAEVARSRAWRDEL